MDNKNYNEILDLIKETTVDLQNLKVSEPIAQIENTHVFVPGTLSLITSSHPAATSRFLSMVAAAASTGSVANINSHRARLHIIDTVSSAHSIKSWRSSVTYLCSGIFPADLTLSSAAEKEPAEMLALAEAIAAGDDRPDILIINNISSMVKSESYAEIKKAMRRLASIAAQRDIHIVVVAQSGFKLSLKRPGRMAALYLQCCDSIFSISHDLDNAAFKLSIHTVDTMETMETTYPLNLAPADTQSTVHSEPTERVEPSNHPSKKPRLNSRQRRRLLAYNQGILPSSR